MLIYRQVAGLIAFLFILGGMLPVAANAVTYDQEKCHIDLPDGWTEQHVEGNKVALVNGDQSKSFIMRIVDTGMNTTLDSAEFIQGFEGSMIKNGLTITGRQHLPLAGVDAYVVDSTMQVPAGTVYNRMIVTLANGYAYGLNISKLNAKPEEDPELNGIINSFGYIGTPQLHTNKGFAEKLGYYTGFFISFLAVIAIFSWMRRSSRPKPTT